MPIAVGTWWRGNASTMIESESGFMSAAPTPCTTRAEISPASLVESAQAIDESVKIARPTRKIFLRPKRSPSFPPSRMSAANDRK